MANTLREQLGTAFNKNTGEQKPTRSGSYGRQEQAKKSSKKNSLNLPRVSDWEGDGIDHINLSFRGLTDLGRTLHPTSRLEFSHDVFGRFNSVSAFWDYIETGARSDKLRMLPHGARKDLRDSLQRFQVEYLEFLVLDACWQRIKAYPALMEELKESVLPFDVYRTVGEMNVPMRTEGNLWLVEGMELIRHSLKKGVAPNFVRWSRNKKRRDIIQEYCAEHLRNAKPAPVRVPKENELLRRLQNNGPVIQQPKRKPQAQKRVVPVSEIPELTPAAASVQEQQVNLAKEEFYQTAQEELQPKLSQVESVVSEPTPIPDANTDTMLAESEFHTSV